jgi:uncharacterized delta-60 repeat protein
MGEVLAAADVLDLPFGTNGITRLAWETADELHAMALQADGKIVLAGNSGNFINSEFTLARFNYDGSLDSSFGSGGRVTADFGVDQGAGALCMTIQDDGRILAAGHQEVTGADSVGYTYIVMARFNHDGSPDSSFGKGGKVVTDIPGKANELASAITLQKDGRIILGASSGNGENQNYTLLRYTPAGILDTTFGTGGIRTTTFGGTPRAIALQPDGKILLAGDTRQLYETSDFAVARFLSDGKTDTTFGSMGRVLTDFGGFDSATSLGLGSDGRIVVAGNRVVNFKYEPILAQYTAAGSLDTSFGQGGKTILNISDASQGVQGLALLADGRVMIAGFIASGNVGNMALVRLLQNGTPDPAFGVGGMVSIGAGPLYSYGAMAIGLQPDGRVLVAGNSNSQQNERDFLLMRFSNAPSPGVITLEASPITESTAVLHAMVNAGGGDTSVSFEYREDSETDFHPVAASPGTVTGTAETPIVGIIEGLKRNTIYHYRAKGVNVAAAVMGNEPAFRTLTFHEVWRQTYFGSFLNAGPGADSNDFDHDGLVNLMEWSLGLDPAVSSVPPFSVSLTSSGLEFIHPCLLSALQEGVVFTTEWSRDPSGPWSSSGVTETTIAEDSTVRWVKSTIVAEKGNRCFVRLKVETQAGSL